MVWEFSQDSRLFSFLPILLVLLLAGANLTNDTGFVDVDDFLNITEESEQNETEEFIDVADFLNITTEENETIVEPEETPEDEDEEEEEEDEEFVDVDELINGTEEEEPEEFIEVEAFLSTERQVSISVSDSSRKYDSKITFFRDGKEFFIDSSKRSESLSLAKGKYDMLLVPTTTTEGPKDPEKLLPIQEIYFRDLEVDSSFTGELGLANLAKDKTPFGKYTSQAYAIDPTKLSFTEAEVTVTARGSELYKCAEWEFDSQICNGDWVKLMDIIPGENYTFTLTPLDPAYAEYNASLGSPRCANTSSPCIANSSLLISRDSITGTSEPNQPNTIDTCADGGTGTYLTDESVENITITSLNGTEFSPGDTVDVTAWVHCWPGGPASDNINFVYTNSTSSISWSVAGFVDPCPAGGMNQLTRQFVLDDIEGEHAVRVIIQYNGATTTTCGIGGYDDNDDVAFQVGTPNIAPEITLNSPLNGSVFPSTGNIILNATAEDQNGDSMTVWIFAGNSTTFSDPNSLVYMEDNVANGTDLTYNITAFPYLVTTDMDLLLHYDNRSKYGEDSTLAYDFSGTDNNATCAGATCPTFDQTGGKFAGAFELDGVDDYWDIDNGYFDAAVDQRTTEVWFKANDVATSTDQFIYEEGGGVNGFNIYIRDSKVFVGAWVGSGATIGEWLNFSTTNDEWHYVALLFDGNNNFTIFYDGQSQTVSVGATMPGHGGDDFIGRMGAASRTDEGAQSGGPNYYFNGTLDEFAIYNRTLTLTEAAYHYQLPPGTYYWKGNVSDGSLTNESETRTFIIGQVGCGEINTSTTLSTTIYSNGTCFNITADDITFNCNNNAVIGNGSGYGFIMDGRSGISIINCNINAFDNSIAVMSTNNSLFQDNLLWNSTYGFFMDPSYNNSIISNQIYNNSLYGLYLDDSYNNSLNNNWAYNNAIAGFYVHNSSNNSLYNNTFYNNGYDFYMNNTAASAKFYNMTNSTFRRPSGALDDFTTLTIHDSVEASTAYSINWTARPSQTPDSGRVPFEDKFINLSTQAGTPSIDLATWSWGEGELTLPTYNESALELWKQNSTNWTMLNDTPDITANTLSIYNHDPASIYGILESDANRPKMELNKTAPAIHDLAHPLTFTINFSTLNGTAGTNISDWGPIIYIRNTTRDETAPQVTFAPDPALYITFQHWSNDTTAPPSIYYGTYWDIYVIHSYDDGQTWSNATIITNDSVDDVQPNMIVDKDKNFILVWQRTEGGDYDIFMSNSTDGINFSTPVAITNNTYVEDDTTIEQDHSTGMYYLTYGAVIPPDTDSEIYIQNSSNLINWSAPIQLTNNTIADYDPDISIFNNTFYLTWAGYVAGLNQEIFYSKSTDAVNSTEWQANTQQITNTSAIVTDYEPSLFVDQYDQIFIAFSSWLNNTEPSRNDVEIVIANSTVANDSIWEITYITNDSVRDTYPGLVQASTGLYHLFYSRNKTTEGPPPTRLQLVMRNKEPIDTDARNVTIWDTVPDNTTLIPGSYGAGTLNGNTITWYLDTYEAGRSGSVSFSVWVNQSVPNGTIITNTAYMNYSDAGGVVVETLNSTSNTLILKNCIIITSPGTYNLIQNIYGAPYTVSASGIVDRACVIIASQDVLFDCNGFNITNNGTSSAAGIIVNASSSIDYTNVTIQNCNGVSAYEAGTVLHETAETQLINNTAYNNTHGFYLFNSNDTNMLNFSFYNNGYDFYANNTLLTQLLLNTTNLSFSGPSGPLSDFTSLDISDLLESNAAFSINWSTNSSALPTNYTSFANKFINITTQADTPSIDEIVWTWTDSETPGYNENLFELWFYNASGWFSLNVTPDTGGNTLAFYGLLPDGIYGIH